MSKVFMRILVIAAVLVGAWFLVTKVICSKVPDLGDILSFFPDIQPVADPTAVTIAKGGVPIPKDSILVNVPESLREGLSLPDTVWLPVEVVVIEGADTTLVSVKVAGVPVQLKDVTYIRQVSPWERWRFCLSAVPYDRPDCSIGVAYQVFRWRDWWMGVAVAADVPGFSWAGIEGRGGWYFVARTSLDIGLGFSTYRDIYGQVGISFRF